jgi:hypothetical protein
MTRPDVERWLTERRPARPQALDERIRAIVATAPNDLIAEAPSMARLMGSLGTRLLAEVRARESVSEGLALDLLAADAFVTYAVEAAAEEGVAVEPLVQQLLLEAAQ